jgi:hypothetical protein
MLTYKYSNPLDFHRRQDPDPVLPPRKTPKDSSLTFDYAATRGIKRLHRLRKVQAEVRSSDAVMRKMRGCGQVLRLSAVEKQSSFLVSAIAVGCVERLGVETRGWSAR